MEKNEMIFGIRAVIEAVQAGKEIDKILIKKDLQSELSKELAEATRNLRIPVQKVPIERINRITRKNHQGVVAFIAAAASAGIPVAEQEETVKIFPGTATAASLCEAAANGTAIVMKVSQCADEIRKAIAMTDDRCTWHYFENVGTEDEFCSTDPEEILSRKMPYFSLLIIKRRQV